MGHGVLIELVEVPEPTTGETKMAPPTKPDIDEQLNQAHQGIDHGSKWPGQSYEEGVAAAIDWMLGETDIKPMDEGQ